jgi:putative radical SAM enzyme (TIGR03279 family)
VIRVHSVSPESLGAELGLAPGWTLLTVNGRELTDFLDWEFLTADDAFVLSAQSPAGEPVEFDVERPEGLPMGVTLEPPRIRRCGNRCDFCFVDGLPAGLRDSLYIRDDDYRLSFRYGNFATLTNLKPKDVERIIEYRLSPLYVSVHATDPVVRRRLLRHPRAPAIIPQLAALASHAIAFHTQIVLQPGLNDGPVLEASLADLWALGPSILSVSVVPVGLTEYSKHHLVRELTRTECERVLETVGRWQAVAMAQRERRWAYGSDDLYLGAGQDFPPAAAYDGFEQVENGVGSVRYLEARIAAAPRWKIEFAGRRVGVFTGTAMGRLMPAVLPSLRAATRATIDLTVVENDLFGPRVTSAGLLPGRALINALRGRPDLHLALLPATAVNDDGCFLDDVTVHEVVAATPATVWFSHDFADVLSNGAAP